MISGRVPLSEKLTSERTWSYWEFAKYRSKMGNFKSLFELFKGSLGMKWHKENTINCLLKRKLLHIFAWSQCSHHQSIISLNAQKQSFCFSLSESINATLMGSTAKFFSTSGSLSLLLYSIFSACRHNLTSSHEPLSYFYPYEWRLQPLLRVPVFPLYA